ncbi:hypothetical protein HFV04_006870 [Pseudomonas sp. BIGb0427]|uniref:hypothetical protein n=1 Tax=unclassified Pseudomonas TaxID=196821 RepID=UPI0018A73B1D|nr:MULTISPECIES: hypothetical protein [unclassified Pseudomonas]QPG64486.1 hypothetical protein HFV04_006870 [Pseudomonas sp. BIGb0427]UVM66925.1 hypothetical protein LOY34_27200 [Pseudomonas sp. B21-009]
MKLVSSILLALLLLSPLSQASDGAEALERWHQKFKEERGQDKGQTEKKPIAPTTSNTSKKTD